MDYEKYRNYYSAYSALIYGLSLKLLGNKDAACEMLENVFVNIAGQGWFSNVEMAGKLHIIQLTHSCINRKLGKMLPDSGETGGTKRAVMQASQS